MSARQNPPLKDTRYQYSTHISLKGTVLTVCTNISLLIITREVRYHDGDVALQGRPLLRELKSTDDPGYESGERGDIRMVWVGSMKILRDPWILEPQFAWNGIIALSCGYG